MSPAAQAQGYGYYHHGGGACGAPSYSYAPSPMYYSPRMSYRPAPMYGERAYRPPQAPQPPQAPAAQAPVSIAAYDNYFEPKTINIAPGTTVRWFNAGQHPHTATAQDDSWDSGDIQPGASYSATFQHPGTYRYYCRHHTQDKMQGVIVVGTTAGGYGGQQPGYGGSQPTYGGQQPRAGAAQPGYGGPQPGAGTAQPGYSGAQPPRSGAGQGPGGAGASGY